MQRPLLKVNIILLGGCGYNVQNYVEQADLRYIEGTQYNISKISDLWGE